MVKNGQKWMCVKNWTKMKAIIFRRLELQSRVSRRLELKNTIQKFYDYHLLQKYPIVTMVINKVCTALMRFCERSVLCMVYY